jgi:hypothetical protein
VVPAVVEGEGSRHVRELTEKVAPLVDRYLEAMEAIRIREGARTLLDISAVGNKYLQVPFRFPLAPPRLRTSRPHPWLPGDVVGRSDASLCTDERGAGQKGGHGRMTLFLCAHVHAFGVGMCVRVSFFF